MAEQVVIEFVGNPSGLKPLADSLRALGQLTEEQEQALNDAAKAYENFGKKAGGATAETADEMQKLNKGFQEFQEGIIGGATAEFAKQMAALGGEVTKVEGKAKTMVGQLRAMKQELATLDVGSKQFQKLAIEAAKLEDKIDKINRRVRTLASDTLAIDTITGAVRGLAGGFAVAQGAAALFGKENEDVQKALLKVNAAMAILQGLQEVSLVLNKNSTVAIGIQSAAQRAYTFVVNGATIATRAFNAALLATGIGAVIAGIGLLVTYWEDIAKWVGLSADKAEDFAEQEEIAAEQGRRLWKLQMDLQENSERAAEERAKEDERRRKEKEAADKKQVDEYIAMTKEAREIQKSLVNAEILGYQTRLLGLKEFTPEYIEETVKLLNARAELEKLGLQDSVKTEEERVAAIKNIMAKLAIDIEKAKTPAKFLVEVDESKVSTEDDYEKIIAAEKEKQDLIRSTALEGAQETSDAIFEITQARRDAEIDAELSALDAQRERELNNKDLTESQRAAIEAKYARKEAKIKEDAYKADKKAKITQAIINGALAITNILATVPGGPLNPAAIAALAAAAATTAFSVATIAAQPIPKFRKGTKSAPGGLAIVGEEGSEIVAHEGQMSVVGKGLTYLPQGAKVIPHPESLKILQGHPDTVEIMKDYDIKQATGTHGIDMEGLGASIGKELRKNQRVSVNIDEHGFSIFVEKGNQRRNYLNKMFGEQ